MISFNLNISFVKNNHGDFINVDDDYFEDKKEHFIMDSFTFQNGETLTDADVEYMTFGKPKYGSGGGICNAILYCSGSLGNFTGIKKILPLTNKGDAFDSEEYFFICMTALGSPKSSSPSSTNLKNKFPKYTIEDMVNFQKQFLKKKFKITHVLGLIGNSMGGFVGLTQAILYPDFQDFLILGVTSYKVAGHDFILSKFVDEIITSDPDYAKGETTYSLIRTLRIASLAEFNFGLSKEALREMSNSDLEVEFENFGNEMIESDIYDLKYCNEASMNYNVEENLNKIKSKVLIIASESDPHFPPELDAIPMSRMLQNSKLIIMDSKLGHLCFSELETIHDELKDFMREFCDS